MSLRVRLSLLSATWFGAGLAPRAPGTVGTVAALPLAWYATTLSLGGQLWLLSLLTLIGFATAQVAGRHYQVADAKQIVIDEVCGLLVTMLGLPWRWPIVLAAFALFRIFDILKPWPASFFDRKIKNGVGVVMDDVMAGLHARLWLALMGLIWPAIFGP